MYKHQQKVHTKVVDASLNQIYVETVNSTVEYIFQYSYPQDVSILEGTFVQRIFHLNPNIFFKPFR